MSSKKNKGFDYQAFIKNDSIDLSKKNRGLQARKRRRALAKTRITINLDAELVDQFKNLVPAGRGYQSLINIALREWLAARGITELVSYRISEVVDQAISSIKKAAESPK